MNETIKARVTRKDNYYMGVVVVLNNNQKVYDLECDILRLTKDDALNDAQWLLNNM